MDNLFSYRIQIVAVCAAILFFGTIVRLIIKGRLRTEYSFIWVAIGFLFLLFSIWRSLLDTLAHFFGVYYAPSLIFIFFFFMIFIFLIHLSVVNSRQHEEIKKLTQEIALIKNKLENKEGKS